MNARFQLKLPLSGRLWPTATVFVLALLWFVSAVHGTFVPASDPHASVFGGPSLFLGLLLMLLYGLYRAWRGDLGVRVPEGGLRALVKVLVAPMVIAAVAFVLVFQMLPSLYTQIFGEPYEGQHVLVARHTPSCRGCDYRRVCPTGSDKRPASVCTSEAIYRQYPDQEFLVRLSGRSSSLGIVVQRADPVASA